MPVTASPVVVSRPHVVYLDSQGEFTGRVVAIDSLSKRQSPLSEVDVQFVKDGVVHQFEEGSATSGSLLTDNNGYFVARGLQPGAYSFIASSGKGFAVFGLLIESNAAGGTNEVTFVAPAISPRFRALKTIFGRYLQGEQTNTLPLPEIATADSVERIVVGANQVMLVGGRLSGRLGTVVPGQPVEGTHVALVQNDRILDETVCDADGNYSLEEVEPGVYDLIAAGLYGCAAVGFEAIAAPEIPVPETGAPAAEEEIQTSLTTFQDAPQSLDVAITPSTDVPVVMDRADFAYDAVGGEVVSSDITAATPIESFGQPVGFGGAAGSYGCGIDSGYFGGYGGYGNYGALFGGIANLAELAIIGWIISEIADSVDNDNPPNPQPISPNN